MRLNALTRTLETVFRRRNIPYQIARGVSFFNRKEIKDATSYLRLLANPADRVALERVINCPPRGIGQTTVQRLVEFADKSSLDLWQAIRKAVGLSFSGADRENPQPSGDFTDLTGDAPTDRCPWA
jgi:DNA helicase-2/ATP-dependent DNA helicase PcrA